MGEEQTTVFSEARDRYKREVSFWDHLFDNDYKQRDDIEALSAISTEQAIESGATRRRLEKLSQRVDRNELLNEALFRWFEAEHGLTAERFRELIVQIDLEDGVEDGRIGKDKTKRAPKCPSCARPVSRKRSQCVYCGADLPHAKGKEGPDPYR